MEVSFLQYRIAEKDRVFTENGDDEHTAGFSSDVAEQREIGIFVESNSFFVGYDIGECTERDRNGVSDNIDVVSAVANNMHIVFLISSDICIQIFWKKLPEQTSDIDGIRIIETYNTECIRDVFSQLSLKFDPFWQSKINVTDYTFWIFIEISNDRIVLMDTNATSRH